MSISNKNETIMSALGRDNQRKGNSNDRFTPYERLKARLDIGRGETFGFDHVHIVSGPNIIFVFLVHGDKAMLLEDDKGLFPSDSLVAKFRLAHASFTS